VKGDQYIVLDDSQDHWWQVENSSGEVGFIPSNYVKKFDDLGLTSFDWYVGDMSRQRAESLLKSEDKADQQIVFFIGGIFCLNHWVADPIRIRQSSMDYLI
jgi:hypothetical protein